MKKNVLLFLTFIFLASLPIIGQTLTRKIVNPSVVSAAIQTPFLRSTQSSVGIPQVFTNQAAFLAAIGSDYALDEYTDLTPYITEDSLKRAAGLYAYTMTSPILKFLYNTLDGVSVNVASDSILIENTGKPIKAFGGYFYNADFFTAYGAGPVRIIVSDYTYTFSPSDSLSFIGFLFPSDISTVSIATTTASGLFVTLDHLYWSDASLAVSVSDAKKTNTIYPNPCSDGIYVNAEGTLSVYNTAGQLVVSQAVIAGSYLSLATLPKGQYIVKVYSESGVLEEKLIKK